MSTRRTVLCKYSENYVYPRTHAFETYRIFSKVGGQVSSLTWFTTAPSPSWWELFIACHSKLIQKRNQSLWKGFMQIFLISFRQLSCNFFTNLLTAVLRVRVVRVLGNINNEKLKLQQRMNIQTILNISVQHTEKLLITNRRRTYNIARIHGNHCHREWSSHWD